MTKKQIQAESAVRDLASHLQRGWEALNPATERELQAVRAEVQRQQKPMLDQIKKLMAIRPNKNRTRRKPTDP